MSVRKTIGRTASEEVSKKVNGQTVTIYRQDTYKQSKSAIYNAFKKIEAGKLTADFDTYRVFTLKIDGTLAPMFKRSIFA